MILKTSGQCGTEGAKSAGAADFAARERADHRLDSTVVWRVPWIAPRARQLESEPWNTAPLPVSMALLFWMGEDYPHKLFDGAMKAPRKLTGGCYRGP